MTSLVPQLPTSIADTDDITGGGERLNPDIRDWGYYATLSIYSFCGAFVKGARVLDAGCGTGFGCAHLLHHGAASVVGVDLSERAIRFAELRYSEPGISFRVMDLCRSGQAVPDSFDVVFCNIGEHLPDVETFLDFCRRSLSSRGLLVLTVPAIAAPGILEGNMRNPYHVTHFTPKGWLAKLGRYFYTAQGFRHWVAPEWVDGKFPREIGLPASETRIRETDFRFISSSAEELNSEPYNICLVTLSSVPRSIVLNPVFDESSFPDDWNVSEIKARIASGSRPKQQESFQAPGIATKFKLLVMMLAGIFATNAACRTYDQKPERLQTGNAAKRSRAGFYRGGVWTLDTDGLHREGVAVYAFGGIAGDIPVVGDWTGDGKQRIGIYRKGMWLLDWDGDGKFTSSDRTCSFGGLEGDIPVVGDWTGDGRTKVGIYRGGTWILDTNGNQKFDEGSDAVLHLGGLPRDIPVVGDWNGSGKSKIGVYRDGMWILDWNGDGKYDGADKSYWYGGIAGDVPVVGDWNGDGKTKIGIVRDGSVWMVDLNGNFQFDSGDLVFVFGAKGALPVVGRWAVP